MNYRELEGKELDQIMNKIREELKERTDTSKIDSSHSSSTSCIPADVTGLNFDNGEDDYISELSQGRIIGQNLPPMFKQHGVKRVFAKFTAKLFLRIAQIITRDIREFNSSVINAFMGVKRNITLVDNKAAALKESVGNLSLQYSHQNLEIEEMRNRLNELEYLYEIIKNDSVMTDQLENINKQITQLSNDNLNNSNRVNELESMGIKDIIAKVNELESMPIKDVVAKMNELESVSLNDAITKVNELEYKYRMLSENIISMKAAQYIIQRELEKTKKNSGIIDNSQKCLDDNTRENVQISNLLYSEFEERFRGTREDIKNRLKIYLPLINQVVDHSRNEVFIDLGCGRGEWLELMRDNSLKCIGVDTNDIQLYKCKELGLEVVSCDALKYLKELDDNTVDVITGFHIVEHFEFYNLIDLLYEAHRVLKQNGIVIFETPNPKNIIVGASNFYTDPTHKRPLHPDALKFFIEYIGFSNANIILANPAHEHQQFVMPLTQGSDQVVWQQNIKQLNDILYGAQDYAIVGYKL